MNAFIDSLWQALRRTDTTRTQAEALAASDDLVLVDYDELDPADDDGAGEPRWSGTRTEDVATFEGTDVEQDGAEDGDPDSYHQQQSARAVRNGTWMWRPEYKHLAREDDADEL